MLECFRLRFRESFAFFLRFVFFVIDAQRKRLEGLREPESIRKSHKDWVTLGCKNFQD